MQWLALVVLGAAIGKLFDYGFERYREHRELRSNDFINVEGRWFAAWQTSVDGKEVIATQPIDFKQRGRRVWAHNIKPSTEHPKGGYLWKSRLEFYHSRYLMGSYWALPSESNSSRGIMYFYYRSQQKRFYGMWSGASFDSDLAAGFLVIAESQEEARQFMKQLTTSNPNRVAINVNELDAGLLEESIDE